MKILVGLGNPGEAYETTRHNAGKIVLDWIAAEWDGEIGRSVQVGSHTVWLVFPDRFMNNSGPALAAFLDKHALTPQPEDMLVIHDELDIEAGRTKLTSGRGSGGHKGVASLIRTLKTKSFWRLRIGVGPRTPAQKKKAHEGDGRDYLLSPFSAAEKKLLTAQKQSILSGIEQWIESPEKAMNILNQTPQ